MTARFRKFLSLALIMAGCGCPQVFGLFGPPHIDEGPEMRPLDLQVRGAPEGIVFTAARPFRAIGCRQISADYQTIKQVWRGECPDGKDCLATAVYGERKLRTEIGPDPLIPGQCYECGAGGSGGRGSVVFRLGADGAIELCDDQKPNRRP
jgi:hypothetical protein